MEVDQIMKLLLVCSVIVLPALGLTARFALKPIVDAILRLKEGGVLSDAASGSALAAEIRQARAELAGLRDEVASVKTEVGRLQEAESFHRALGTAADAGQPALPPGSGS